MFVAKKERKSRETEKALVLPGNKGHCNSKTPLGENKNTGLPIRGIYRLYVTLKWLGN